MWLSILNQDQSWNPNNVAEGMAYRFQGLVTKAGSIRARIRRLVLETLSRGQRDELGVAGVLASLGSGIWSEKIVNNAVPEAGSKFISGWGIRKGLWGFEG